MSNMPAILDCYMSSGSNHTVSESKVSQSRRITLVCLQINCLRTALLSLGLDWLCVICFVFFFQSGPLSDIIPAFLASENAVFTSNNWRLQEMLMNNLSCLNKCYSSENIYNKVIPILRQKLLKAVRYHSLNASCQGLNSNFISVLLQ